MRTRQRNLKQKLDLEGLQKSKLSLFQRSFHKHHPPPSPLPSRHGHTHTHTHAHTHSHSTEQHEFITPGNSWLAALLLPRLQSRLLSPCSRRPRPPRTSHLLVTGTSKGQQAVCLLWTFLASLETSIVHRKTTITFICCVCRILFPVRSCEIQAFHQHAFANGSSQLSFKTFLES